MSDGMYTFDYQPKVDNVDDFVERFVIGNPHLNVAAVMHVIDKVKARARTHIPAWNKYQAGQTKVTLFAFIQNSEWIGNEYFSGMCGTKIADKIKNAPDDRFYSFVGSINMKIRELFREMTREEAAVYRERTVSSSNPAGFVAATRHNVDDIKLRFASGERVKDIAIDYNCHISTIVRTLKEVYSVEEFDAIRTRVSRQKTDVTRDKNEAKKREAETRRAMRKEREAIARAERQQKKLLEQEHRRINKPPRKLRQTRRGEKVVIESKRLEVDLPLDYNKLYSILSSKPHNSMMLDRYVRFILACQAENMSLTQTTEYIELHHIAPKSRDLFPEYFSFSDNPWNKVLLTFRQHFIAHWMLWKAYGGQQSFAFRAMANCQKSSVQDRSSKINSATYAILKNEARELAKHRRGFATYHDRDTGERVYCETTDERVLSGQLISNTTGRKCKPRSREARNNTSRSKWRRTPMRHMTLYFLDIEINVPYTEHDFAFIHYLDQGWSTRLTPELLSKMRTAQNVARFERHLDNRIRRGDYSKFEYLYDTIDCVVLMGIKRSLDREHPDRYVRYSSTHSFEYYRDVVTGKIHQLDPKVFPIIDTFVLAPDEAKRRAQNRVRNSS